MDNRELKGYHRAMATHAQTALMSRIIKRRQMLAGLIKSAVKSTSVCLVAFLCAGNSVSGVTLNNPNKDLSGDAAEQDISLATIAAVGLVGTLLAGIDSDQEDVAVAAQARGPNNVEAGRIADAENASVFTTTSVSAGYE